MNKLPKGVKYVMSVVDEEGVMHKIYGDDFVHLVLIDVLEKLKSYELKEAKQNGAIN